MSRALRLGFSRPLLNDQWDIKNPTIKDLIPLGGICFKGGQASLIRSSQHGKDRKSDKYINQAGPMSYNSYN